MSVAVVILPGEHRGRFEADKCEVRDGFVHAVGRWVRKAWVDGAEGERRSTERRYSWPAGAIEEIRWA